MRTLYKIEGRGNSGDWDESYSGNSASDNTFDTRAEAEEMLPVLAKSFECDVTDFRVVER